MEKIRDNALSVIINQMNVWAEQMNLPLTPDFIELTNQLNSQNKLDFDVDSVKGLYKKKIKNVISLNPEKYDVTIIDVAKDYGLDSAQKVKIKADRQCICGSKILKGATYLTVSKRVNGRGQRSWICCECANHLMKLAKKESDELYNNDEPDWDDGKSSNGY